MMISSSPLNTLCPHPYRKRIAAWSLVAFLASGIADGQVPAARLMPLGDSLTIGNNDINYPNGDIPGGFRKELGSLLTNGNFPFDFVGSLGTNAAAAMDPDHEGHPGFRTDQVLDGLPAWLAAKPDVVLLMVGTNDMLQGVPVATAAANLDNLIELINASDPDRRLYVSTIPPISGSVNWNGQTPAQMNANADLYNIEVRNLVQVHANLGRKIFLVDMSALLVIDDPLPENDYFQPGDGIHPGQAGYNQLGLLWFNAITTSGLLLDPPIAGLPAAPTGLSVTVASPSRINLTWTDNASNESVYRVRRRPVAGGPWEEIAILPADSTGHAVTGLRTAVESFVFAVLASNLRGDSAWSNIVSSPASGDRAHFKPSSASSVYNNLSQYVAAKANDGNISTLWASASAGNQYWQVDLNNNSHIQQIKLVTRQDSDVALHRKNFEIRASNDPAFASYSVLASQGSTPLPYQSTLTSDVANTAPFRFVRVAKTDGASFAISLVQVAAADFVATPAAPANLTASGVDSSHVRLTWDVISSNESGFKLERKTGAGGIYLQIATPAAASTTFVDAGPAASTTYFYRLCANNETGDSAFSNEVEAMTGTAPAYQLWAANHPAFLSLSPAERLPDADPNGDGTVNLFAYAAGLDPLANLPAGAIAGIDSPDPARIFFRFRRNRMAPDLSFEVLVNSNLTESGQWSVLNLAGATITSIEGNPGVEEVSVPLFLAAGESRKFARLRVVQSPPPGP